MSSSPLLSFALAALGRLPAVSADGRPETNFLHQFVMAPSVSPSWLDKLVAYVQSDSPAPIDQPLLQIANELQMSLVEILTVALAVAVEEDALVARVVAFLQEPTGGTRPTIGLCAVAFADAVTDGSPALHWLLDGHAVQSGLLSRSGENVSLVDQALSVSFPLYLALRQRDASLAGTTLGLGPIPVVPFPESVRDEAERQARALPLIPRGALAIRSASQAEARRVAALVASIMGRRPLFIETDKLDRIGVFIRLRRLLPVFCFDLAPGERKVVPQLPFYDGPALVLCGPDGNVERLEGSMLSWTLAVPSEHERHTLWLAATGDPEIADVLSKKHRHRAGRIADLGRLARQHAATHQRNRADMDDIFAAAWTGEAGGLGALAQALPDRIDDDALVLGDALRQDLQTLLLRCEARDSLAVGLGPSATTRYRPGVRALFVGPSGTGKTLAAGWLATKLGTPLYRVDLASVTSKYIGETEKNLAQVFARAENAEVVLLFDEADSMFGKRTDVKDANDRFANAQTNYLLQRLESFDGITILTSNNKSRIEQAFMRRLDAIIEFPLPGSDERKKLWLSHLGPDHALTPQQLARLAVGVDLAGGHVRNVVLIAALFAQHAGRPIAWTDILKGLAAEYKKLGRAAPSDLRGTD